MPNLSKRFGIYDSEPAVWNDSTAWVFIGGRWNVTFTDAWHTMNEARLMTRAQFMERFPNLPPLPR
jgi:hypothetical protein